MPPTKTAVAADPSKTDFENLVNLLSIYTEAQNRLDQLAASANQEFIDTVDGHRDEYSKLLESQTEAESAIEVLALRHPEWFGDKKTVTVPYGQVKLTKSTRLKAANEEVSVLLIEQSGHPDKVKLVRLKAELNLEALEALSDDELAAFRIKRVTEQNVKVTAAKVNLGNAIKEKAKKEAA